MAGSLFISENSSWFYGSQVFFPIMDRIRDAFPADRPGVADQIFSTMDVFCFASIQECGTEDFMLFVGVAEAELVKFLNNPKVQKSEYFPGLVECWNELISLLKKDPRYTGLIAS